jgi:cyclopropane fatty-acyl-phospholipid synthase-like methyltransferase
MKNQDNLSDYLESFPKESTHIYISQNKDGYWSNLSKKQNAELMAMLGTRSTKECITATEPSHVDVIFSEKRAAGLELLQLTGTETAVDLGCMWGAISIPLAKQTAAVLGVDQTIESLKFSEARAKEENLDNISFLCGNLREITLPQNTFDVAIVNGVLEWVPEQDPVVVEDYWYKAKYNAKYKAINEVKSEVKSNPGEIQKAFLENVYTGLKDGGRLMLAIENRYDYKMFFGIKDPHTGTLFTTLVPKWLANIISKIVKKREYTPWIYSFKELEQLLKSSGFSSVELHACWPDYRNPEHINKYGVRNPHFTPISAHKRNGKIGFKKLVANRIEWTLFKVFNIQFFAPSIIAIAHK